MRRFSRPTRAGLLVTALLCGAAAAPAGAASPLPAQEWREQLEQLRSSRSARDRTRLAHELARERRAHPELGRMASETNDRYLRRAIFAGLAEEGGGSGIRILQRLHAKGSTARKIEILDALESFPGGARALYRIFVAPHLRKNDPIALQSAALQLLASHRDPRFFQHFEELFAETRLSGQRSRLVAALCQYDEPRVLQILVPFVEQRLPRVENAFFEHAPKMRSPGVGRWMRERGVRHFDALVRRTALRQIQRTVRPEDLQLLTDAARDEEQVVAAEAIRALSLLASEEAADALHDIADRGRPRAAATALRALFAHARGRKRALDFCLEAIASYRPSPIRIAAMDLVEESHARALERELLAAAEDGDSRVRIAAYRALSFVRENRIVEVLLKRLAVEDGTARHFLLEALRDLTAHDQGNDPSAWFTWWELAKETFTVPPKKAQPGERRPPEPGRTSASYYGIDILAKNMAFIIDLSGSMRLMVDGKSRLDHAKRELVAALQKLPPTSRFNIVPFSNEPSSWREQLTRATPANVRSAIEFVRGLRVGGSTNIYDSLELCLEMEGIESIFLLSDGGPSSGKFVSKPEIRREVRDRNQERRIRVHTIMIGGSKSDRRFMQRLARENHGQNVDQ